ncbi:MAG TPA: ATP-binding cassette domain-containing protein [Candidatus Limnocylindrales bacterium]|nr:ATP-binding cassette domain-containing protein [Candidatus Limnocylindrales bacterium]
MHARSLTVRLRREHHRVRSLRELFVRTVQRRPPSVEWFDALRDVSLHVARGGVTAVVGPNGAGKTTLLRALAGIVPASAGSVAVRGRLAPLIELGAGFDPELTGRENVFLFGVLLGRRLSELRRDYDSIVEMSGLADAMDVAVKSYSSGMTARLGFAVATAGEPDVLLVDEVLSVGDADFRSRCDDRIASLRSRGTAIVLVTHDMALVERVADDVLRLEAGRMVESAAAVAAAARIPRVDAPASDAAVAGLPPEAAPVAQRTDAAALARAHRAHPRIA